jgi:putative flippase GtrA
MRNSSQKTRFIAVGAINTILDFGILFLLKSFGLPAITANVFSTTAAFCFSFFANKKYTFKTTDVNVKREVVLFVIVTLFGLWVLQTIVIKVVSSLLIGIHLSDNDVLLIAKICATVVSLVWNYILYSRVVFKQPANADSHPLNE